MSTTPSDNHSKMSRKLKPQAISGSPHNNYAVTNLCYVYPGLASTLGLKDGSYLKMTKNCTLIMKVRWVSNRVSVTFRIASMLRCLSELEAGSTVTL